MKHFLMTLVMSVASISSAVGSDLNNCGPDYQRWMGYARSLKNSLYTQAGIIAVEGKGEISMGAVEMYLKSCKYAAESVNPGGCYDSLIKKDLFPATVAADCNAFVEKLMKLK